MNAIPVIGSEFGFESVIVNVVGSPSLITVGANVFVTLIGVKS